MAGKFRGRSQPSPSPSPPLPNVTSGHPAIRAGGRRADWGEKEGGLVNFDAVDRPIRRAELISFF